MDPNLTVAHLQDSQDPGQIDLLDPSRDIFLFLNTFPKKQHKEIVDQQHKKMLNMMK